jgi:hypothetical protein
MTPARADDFGSVEVSSNFIQAAKIPFCLQPANDAAKFYGSRPALLFIL